MQIAVYDGNDRLIRHVEKAQMKLTGTSVDPETGVQTATFTVTDVDWGVRMERP